MGQNLDYIWTKCGKSSTKDRQTGGVKTGYFYAKAF